MQSDLIYIDANIVIYLLEGDERYSHSIADRIATHYESGGRLVTSVMTISEFIAGPTYARLQDVELLPHLTIAPIDLAIAEQAGLLRREYRIKPIDALHLATAIICQSATLFTNDRSFAKIATQYLTVITP